MERHAGARRQHLFHLEARRHRRPLVQQIAAIDDRARPKPEYAEMMMKGGRSPDGNRSKSEWKNRG
jgi:hypothetical protein